MAMVAPRTLAATENVVPREGDSTDKVCSRAPDDSAWRSKAPYPGAYCQMLVAVS